MLKIFLYFIAYLSCLVGWLIFVIIILNLLNLIYIRDASMLAFIALPFVFIYHKYKPMEFKELLKKIKQKFQS